VAGRNVGRRQPRTPAARLSLGLVLALFATLVMLAAGPPRAYAHAVLAASSITPGSLIAALPATLTLTFSEDLAAGKSNIGVSGPDGGSALLATPVAQPDDHSLTVPLQSRGAGTYKVYWNSVSSQDGRVTAGAFTFAVGYVSAPGDLSTPIVAHGVASLNVIKLVDTLVQWLLLLVALAWAGGSILEMPPGASSTRPALSGGDAWITTLAPQARVVKYRLLEVLLGLLFFSWLLSAAAVVTAGRVSLMGSLTGLFSGHLGLARVLALLTAAIALFDVRRSSPSSRPTQNRRPAARIAGLAKRSAKTANTARSYLRRVPPLGRWGSLAVSAIFLLALASGSHAAGVPSVTLSSVLLEWLHSLAAATWIGGMTYLTLTALPVLESSDLDKRAPLLLGLLRRYATFTCAAIAVLVVTGIFAAQVQVGTRAQLNGNTYGHALLLKSVLVAAALALTFYVLVLQRAHVENIWTRRQRLESLAALDRLGRGLRIGAVLGALVLGATAVLESDPPPAAGVVSPFAATLPPLPATAWHAVGLRGQVVHRLLFQPNNRHVLWAATNTGVWRSIDDQKTWQRVGVARRFTPVLDLLALDGGHGMLAGGANGQMYRTYDSGKHWQRLGKPFGTHPLRVLAAHGSILIAAGDDGIFRSTDDSRHWHQVLALKGQGIATVYWSTAESVWLAAARLAPWPVYRAQPTAGAWTEIGDTPNAAAGVAALASTSGAGQRFLAGTAGDGGWTAPQSGGPWSRIHGVAADGVVAAVLTDGRTLGRMYLGTAGSGVFASADGGTMWAALGSNNPRPVNNLVMRPGPTRILFAATNNGAFRLVVGP
jgi:putative copper export protein/methionine-rich copper-binding protein CopC